MRIRTIKPEFWRSDDIAALTRDDRLLFIGLWSYVDDSGIGLDKLPSICGDLFAPDLETDAPEVFARVRGGLQTLHSRGLIHRYTVDGRDFLYVTGWDRHQRIDKPSRSRYPGPDQGERIDSGSPRENFGSPRVKPAPGTEEQGNRGTVTTRARNATLRARRERFEEFYALYPKKAARGAAKARWDTTVEDTPPDEIIAGLRRLLPWFATQLRDGNDYRPSAAPWLHAQRWLDEPAGLTRTDPYSHIRQVEPGEAS